MRTIIVLLGLAICSFVYSNTPDNTFWQDVESLQSSARALKDEPDYTQTLSKRSLRLDEAGLKDFLLSFNVSSRPIGPKTSELILDLPLPNGNFVKVTVTESAVLSRELQEQYPDIKTWQVAGVDDPSVSGRLDFTSKGFHGMLVLANGDTVYIDPDENENAGFYSSFSKQQNLDHFKTDFNCQVHDEHKVGSIFEDIPQLASKVLTEKPNLGLITYRLALAGTAEYTESQGGTSAKAYASMVTTINRVNEIYQRDLGIKLQLVSDESTIYSNPSADPYTNHSAMALVSENIKNLNAVVGPDNYDIGHVFAHGPLGGLAYAATACQENYKAGGATGTPTPKGETFSVEYVAHEMGHQLGATHTFNSQLSNCSGNHRVQITAVEPGSGSTIMSYSGLCGSDNIQTNSDAVFHWASISQIAGYTHNATGSSCGTRTPIESPEVNAGSDFAIPTNTPFFLKGTATTGISFSWDQLDAGSASSVDEDLGDNAIIRSLLPSSGKGRYVPALKDLFADTRSVGETLPKTNRELNFAFVSRDKNSGIGTDLKKITVIDTAVEFKVLSQSTPQTLSAGQPIDVLWNVAGTDTSPINCKQVDIQLLRANGIRNPLLVSTTNDGREQFVIPPSIPSMTNARVMVSCSNNSFFQISSADLTIEGSTNIDAPIISILGDKLISIELDSIYTDSGASAIDKDGNSIEVITSGTVNPAVLGKYEITYSATDKEGNTSIDQRVIEVTDGSGEKNPESTAGGSLDPLLFLFLALVGVRIFTFRQY